MVNRTVTITIGKKAAIRTAFYILWYTIRYPRSSVTFEVDEALLDPLVYHE